MAMIYVNDDIYCNGRITVEQISHGDGNPREINGVFATHWYFEEITKLSTDRFELKGVEVVKESIGSDAFDVVYTFVAEELAVKGMTDLDIDVVNKIESKMYREDGRLIGGELDIEGDDSDE